MPFGGILQVPIVSGIMVLLLLWTPSLPSNMMVTSGHCHLSFPQRSLSISTEGVVRMSELLDMVKALWLPFH